VTFIQNNRIQNAYFLSGAFAATAVMLTLAQPPIGWWALAWVAYVPFIIACTQRTFTAENPSSLRYEGQAAEKNKKFVAVPATAKQLLVAYIVGACFWLGNLYWLSYVTVAGWIAFCFYTALLWPVLVIGLRWCIRKKVPLVVAAPILIVGIENTQGLFLGGFYWDHLSHSQYTNTMLTQIADIFGAAGVSFLVATVNGAVSQLILTVKNLEFRIENLGKKKERRFSILNSQFSILIAVAAIGGTLIYGHWRIEQTGKFVKDGPVVAAVQTNVPQSVKESFAAEQQMLDTLVNQSEQCIKNGAKLIVWPETMVQAILEPQVLQLLDESHQYKVFNKTIRNLARRGVYILAGAYGGSPRIEENFDIRMAEKYNSAFLYTPDGNVAPEKYYKIHLVPFGEYLPFENIPLIHNLFLKMTPYDFDYTLNPGTKYTVFNMKAPDSNSATPVYKFSVMICYEDAVAGMARHFVLDKSGKKSINWLLNISNDGWFVRFKNDKVVSSTELIQHNAVCTYRAIENRLAVLRSVNTGISCMIDTLGRVRDGYLAGNLPKKAVDRQAVEGWFADIIPIDGRTTFFSRYGQWLDLTCQLCLGLLIIAQFVEQFVIKHNLKGKKIK
jgi:apolipoprotein N-acyltransferase